MNTILHSEILRLEPEDNHRLFNLCGKLNEHLKLIEKRYSVMIKQRGHTFSVIGNRRDVRQACDTLNNLYHETEKVSILEPKEVHLYLQTVGKKLPNKTRDDHMELRLRKGIITARGENQVHYLQSILQSNLARLRIPGLPLNQYRRTANGRPAVFCRATSLPERSSSIT